MNESVNQNSRIVIHTFVFESGRSGRGRVLMPIDECQGNWKGDVMEGGLRIVVDGKTILSEQEFIEITVLWRTVEFERVACILEGNDYTSQYEDILNLVVSIKCSGDRCKLGFQYDGEAIADASVRRVELARSLIQGGKHFWSVVRTWSISSWMNGRAESALINLDRLARKAV
jgi:hypothetical protein